MAAENIDALNLNITSSSTTESVDKLIDSLTRLGTALDKLKSKSVSVNIRNTGAASASAAGSVNKLNASFLGTAVKLTAVIALFRKLSKVISSAVSNSATYIKSLNMFTVSMGEYAENATKYGEAVSAALGIDISGWQKTQGIFQTLITGFGVTGDKAAYMSQNITQLSYDIASFYGITNEEAANKIKSALSGRLEPIRKLGYDLSQSKLVDIAKNPANYGKQTFYIDEETGAIKANTIATDDNTKHKIVNFNQLTQQEKVQLRYIALMTEVTQVQGNYARALSDPHNQLVVFKEQLNQTSRALGNVFIPILNKALPYLSAFAQLAKDAFQSIANLLGFELPDMKDRTDISGNTKPYNDVVKATGNAAKNAKKLKDYMLGIDELNVFNPNTSAGGAGSAGGQNSNLKNLKLPGYDFLSKAVENSIAKAKAAIQKLFKDLKENPLELPLKIIGAGFGELGDKVGTKFWEWLLGKSPDQLAKDAATHGRTLGEEFYNAVFEGLGNKGSDIWSVIFGKTPHELALEAERNGNSTSTQFYLGFVDGLPSLPSDWVKNVPFMDALFGSPDGMGKRAADSGRTVAEQFTLEFGKKCAETVSKSKILSAMYKVITGRDVNSDLANMNRVLSSKANKKSSALNDGNIYPYISADQAKRASWNKEHSAQVASGTGSAGATVANGVVAETTKTAKKITGAMSKTIAEGKDEAGRAMKKVYNSALSSADNNGKGANQFAYVSYHQAKAYYDSLSNKKSLDGAIGGAKKLTETASTGLDENGTIKKKFGYISADEAKAYYSKFSANATKKSAKSATTSLAAAAGSGLDAGVSAFKKAGENSAKGYISGINKYLKEVGQAGADMGAKALEEANKKTKTASPSKAFAEIGMYNDLGYANGVKKYAYLVSDAVSEMAGNALSTMRKASVASNGIITGNGISVPTSTNAGYSVGASNEGAMASLASNIYQAVMNGMANANNGTANGGDIKVIIDGKEVFKAVQTESRKRGVAISNGAFSR